MRKEVQTHSTGISETISETGRRGVSSLQMGPDGESLGPRQVVLRFISELEGVQALLRARGGKVPQTPGSPKRKRMKRFGPRQSFPPCIHHPKEKFVAYIAPCCKEPIPCRWCHDRELEHHLNMSTVKEVFCGFCGRPNGITEVCRHCDRRLADNVCLKCKVYSAAPVFHCKDCGKCKRGREDAAFHCNKCRQCIHIYRKESHPCESLQRLRSDNDECAACLEHLLDCGEPLSFLACGHVLHLHCRDASFQAANLVCPICRRSGVNRGLEFEALRQRRQERDARQAKKRSREEMEGNGEEAATVVASSSRTVEAQLDGNGVRPPNSLRKLTWSCNDCHHETIRTERDSDTLEYEDVECEECGSYNTSLK
eukprot:Clim_evm48s231 gene=Clim_evmTU48s231